MAIKTAPAFFLFYFFFSTLLVAIFQPGFAAEDTVPFPHLASKSPRQLAVKIINEDELRSWKRRNSRRLMIGSTAPTCTYNECRGCKYKCKAEQIPVDANDPINSAYHYKCVCHR